MDPAFKLHFKPATTTDELAQVHALNHRIFAEEIAQHPLQSSGLLVDRFHDGNSYFLALKGDEVVGMISAHPGPQFSVARRLPDPDSIAAFPKPLEVRLLAVDRQARNRTVLAGLLWQVYDFAHRQQHSHLLISAIAERESMYRKLGFLPLGPAVEEGAASFVPMALSMDEDGLGGSIRLLRHRRHWNRHTKDVPNLSLLPGPVNIHPEVAQSFATPPVSHRSRYFTDRFEETREHLRRLIPGSDVVVFPGAGTLANDAVAANLQAVFAGAEGLILSNGEFGERLARQASGAGLRFRHLASPWGAEWSPAELGEAMDRRPAWIWAVHLETSTGVVNDVGTLLRMAGEAGSAVALDCVSSLGAVPIGGESESLLFASGVSGKALGSFAGLAFVYLGPRSKHLLAQRALPRSFDLFDMRHTSGPASTIASPLLFALGSALEQSYGSPEAVAARFEEYKALGEYVREQMRALGLHPLAAEAVAAPNVTTFPLPSPDFPQKCLATGFTIAHESSYLLDRGWGQIATMGHITPADLEPLFRRLRQR